MTTRPAFHAFLFLMLLLSVGLSGCIHDDDDDGDEGQSPPPAASSDADLSALTVSPGTLDPAFSADVTAYAVSVGNGVTEITVTATASDDAATLTVDGSATDSGAASAPIDLAVGTTQIDVVVTAEDGTTKTYSIAVTREPSTDATLSDLELSAATLNETFDPATTAYTADVANDVDTTTVTATANDEAATLEIEDTAVDSGTASDPIALAVGENTIAVTVTAEDGITTETYTVTVTRAEPPVVSSSVEVLVLDDDGKLLEGATLTVESSGEIDTTGTDGRATVAVVQDSRELIRISAPGYLPQTLPVSLPPQARPGVFTTALMARAASVQIAAAESGGSATGSDGASVTLPAGALVDGNGQPVTGAVDVFLTPLDVSDDRDFRAFPGGFEAENASGEPGFMLSFGTVDFRFEQNGEVLSLADGQTATIDIPIYVPNDADGTPLAAGAAIPLWSLDEASSLWLEEAQGTVVASAASPTGFALRGEVTHFSWWNADKFRRPGELDVTVDCSGLGVSCTSEVEVPASNLSCAGGGNGGPRFSGTYAIAGGGTLPRLPVPGDTDLDCDAEADGRLSATTNPDPVNAPAGTILPVDVILRPAYDGDEPFVPGERLRGEMTSVGETHTWRFNGVAGEIFRLTAYPAESGVAAPGLTGNLGATVAVFSGTTELASATFESTIAGEVEVELPSDGEFEVRFTADGKVPGWYVATTELDAPAVSAANGRVAFTAINLDDSTARRLFTVPSGVSPYQPLSGPFPENARGVLNDPPIAGVYLEYPGYREVTPGTIVYIADQETNGRFELFSIELGDPGNPVKLSGPEVEAVSGRIIEFQVSPADPTLIVYQMIASAGDAIYVVDTDDPGNPVRLGEPSGYANYAGGQRNARFVAGGTAVVYQADSTVSGSISDGQLFLVDLANPGVATRLNGPIDESAGEQLRRFDLAGAVSPDGNLVAYSAEVLDDPETPENEADPGALFLVDINDPGNPVARVEDDLNATRAGEIAFSPDGTKLVYVRERFDGAGDGPLWFADITDPANPVPGATLDSNVDFRDWWISPASDYVVTTARDAMLRYEFASPGTIVDAWDFPVANGNRERFRFAPDGEGIVVQLRDSDARQTQLWLHRWSDDRAVQTRLGPAPSSLLADDWGVHYFDLAADGTLYYMADVGNVELAPDIFATSLTAPDADRIKVVERVEGFFGLEDPRNGSLPLFIILEAGQNAGL